jgi:hypothetical protein
VRPGRTCAGRSAEGETSSLDEISARAVDPARNKGTLTCSSRPRRASGAVVGWPGLTRPRRIRGNSHLRTQQQASNPPSFSAAVPFG